MIKLKKQIQPTDEVEKHLKTIIEGIKADVDLSFLNEAKLYTAGSSNENPFGFTGQFAIREMLTMTPQMQKLLSKPSHDLTTKLIEDVAVSDGMLTLEQDGAIQALKGNTTYEEIYRVIG